MARRITVIQGHPYPGTTHFGHALMAPYARGTAEEGHEVRQIMIAELDFPVLRRKEDWEEGAPAPAIRAAQENIAWADQLVINYPLWLGTMPALLKAFLEQTLRPGFAIGKAESGGMDRRRLKGRSARIVITMGMPAVIYRWYFRAHSLKSLERSILALCGIGPVKASLIGKVEGKATRRERWLAAMATLGRRAG